MLMSGLDTANSIPKPGNWSLKKTYSKVYLNLSLHINQKKTDKNGHFYKKVHFEQAQEKAKCKTLSQRGIPCAIRLFVLLQIIRWQDPRKGGRGPGTKDAVLLCVAKGYVNEWIHDSWLKDPDFTGLCPVPSTSFPI